MKHHHSRLPVIVLSTGLLSVAAPSQNQPGAHVLPTGMLPVPASEVRLGTDAKGLIESVTKLTRSKELQIRGVSRLMSELGEVTVQLDAFFMSKNLVTNGEYKVFVEKTGHRFPFHWWRYGREDDYEKRIPDINETIKSKENKDLLYWQQNWRELPYAIPRDTEQRTRPTMEDYPVIYVSWKDAVAYAAWAGMRLPTEAEWVFAASKGKTEFLWGDDFDGLPIDRGPRYDRLWPVGKWADAAKGPFGHEDLVLGVWEWTNDLGFFPLDRSGRSESFENERKKLLRDKLLRDQNDADVDRVHHYRPEWRGDKVVCKGGWYGSQKDELRVATRAPQESFQTRAGIGFRLAKSEKPALDIIASLLKLDYDISIFGDRSPRIDDQVGIERYELSPDGHVIEGYHALSLVPLDFMTDDKKLRTLNALLERSSERPLQLATLVVTDPVKEPAIGRGIYTIAYRHAGMPTDLAKALVDARKALQAIERAKKKGEEPPESTGDWAKTLKQFGITNEEALAGGVDFVRVSPGALKVPAKENRLLVRNAAGDYIASMQAPTRLQLDGKYLAKGASVSIAAADDGTEVVSFDFGVAQTSKERNRGYTMRLKLVLPPESTGGANWRTPDTPIAATGSSFKVKPGSERGQSEKRVNKRSKNR